MNPGIYVGEFDDYHDIQDFANNTNSVFKAGVKFAEIGFAESGLYVGAFWVGRKPSVAAVEAELKRSKIEMDEDGITWDGEAEGLK